MKIYHYDPDNYDPGQQDPYRRNPWWQEPGGQEPWQRNPGQPPRRYKEPGSSGMAMASVVLGVCSFVLMLSGMSPFLGGLGILLALLSRGSGKMSGTGKAGLIASACGLVIGTGVLFSLMAAMLNSSAADQYYDLFNEYYYGDDYSDSDGSDEYIREYGDNYDPGNGYGDYLIPDDGWYSEPYQTSPDTGGLI